MHNYVRCSVRVARRKVQSGGKSPDRKKRIKWHKRYGMRIFHLTGKKSLWDL